MKMQRISQTDAFTRIPNFFEERRASLALLLQQQLDSFSSQRRVDDPYGSQRTIMEPSGATVGEFVVEPIPQSDMAYVREGDQEIMVDPMIAVEFLQNLSPGTTNEQVWEALNQAVEDTATEGLWEMQFTARRRR